MGSTSSNGVSGGLYIEEDKSEESARKKFFDEALRKGP